MEDLAAFEGGEVAEVMIWSGPYRGRYVPCRVAGTSDIGETFDIHVLPTTDFGRAGGHSDCFLPRIPRTILRKANTAEAGQKADGRQQAIAKLTKEDARALLQELLDGYSGKEFQSQAMELL